MSDFSAAAILRLIPIGLKRQGIDMSIPSAPQTAHMSVEDKRNVLDTIASRHGEHALVRLGEGVADAPDEPILTALAMAREPEDLIARWQRLERYVHSQHRVRLERTEPCRLLLHHLSLNNSPAPLRHEDLLILGLLVGLLEWIGANGLKMRLAGETNWRYCNQHWQSTCWPQSVARWEIEWTARVAHSLTSDIIGSKHQSAGSSTRVYQARHFLSRDPARPWTVAALAGEMAMAARSLQRLLAKEQSSFSALLAQARATSAAHALTTTAQSLAQIGYACGYADQAHFGREFKRHTALTPLQYRSEFSARAK